jgi:hypothetical protein
LLWWRNHSIFDVTNPKRVGDSTTNR